MFSTGAGILGPLQVGLKYSGVPEVVDGGLKDLGVFDVVEAGFEYRGLSTVWKGNYLNDESC